MTKIEQTPKAKAFRIPRADDAKLVSMHELRAARGQPLKLTVTIPGPYVPLFRALVEVHPWEPGDCPATDSARAEAFASYAVCWYLLSEEASQSFDNLVNGLSGK